MAKQEIKVYSEKSSLNVTVEALWESESANDHQDATNLVDVSTLKGVMGQTVNGLVIKKIWFTSNVNESTTHEGVWLLDGNNNVIVPLSGDSDNQIDFCQVGGIINTKDNSTGANGDLKIACGVPGAGATRYTNMSGVSTGSGYKIKILATKSHEDS